MKDSFNSVRESVLRHGKSARGRNELLKHLDGGRLSTLQAIKAHCYDCSGFYGDGKVYCEMPDCALSPFMPFNPVKRQGKKQTEKQKADFKARMQATRRPKIKL